VGQPSHSVCTTTVLTIRYEPQSSAFPALVSSLQSAELTTSQPRRSLGVTCWFRPDAVRTQRTGVSTPSSPPLIPKVVGVESFQDDDAEHRQ
jgi:hypothetical protein